MRRDYSILITGGAGFIGSCFAIDMIARGHKVIVIDALTYAGDLSNLAEIEKHENYSFVKGNINDTELVSKLLKDNKIDWLVNFAAESHVDNSIASPNIFVETNVNGTLSLLNASLAYYKQLSHKDDFRFLHVSTDEVYGSLGPTGYFSETSPYQPNSPYSASKAGADHLVRAWYETYSLPTIITNCSNNYGPYQHPEKLIPTIIRNCRNQTPIPVYGDGSNIRDWLYVVDHCDAIDHVIRHAKTGETYNVGGNQEISNLVLVKMICQEMDKLYPGHQPHENLISFVTDRLGHDWRYAINPEKIIRDLQWQPLTKLQEGLQKTIAFYLTSI